MQQPDSPLWVGLHQVFSVETIATGFTRGEIVTGLLFIDQNVPDMHEQSRTMSKPLKDMEYADLNPGSAALAELQKRMK